jgi:hypothetical protein
MTKTSAKRTNLESINSLPLFTATCSSQSLRFYGILCQVLLSAVAGGLAIGSSNHLQQVCTSPTFSDVKRKISLAEIGNLVQICQVRYFDVSDTPVFWAVLAFTTVPMQLALDATIGNAYLPIPANFVGICASDFKHQSALRVPFKSRDMVLGSTELQWVLINSTSDAVSSNRCREPYGVSPYPLQNIDRVPFHKISS